MKNEAKRVWLYSHINSTAAYDAAELLQQQEIGLKRYAEERGLGIAGVSSDLCYWSSPDRPGLDRVLQEAKNGAYEVLLITGLSRLGRDTQKVINIVRQLNNHGISVVSVLEGEIEFVREPFSLIPIESTAVEGVHDQEPDMNMC